MGVVHPGGDAIHFEDHWYGHQNNEWTLPSWLQSLVLISVNEDSVTWLEPGVFRGSSCYIYGLQLGPDTLVG